MKNLITQLKQELAACQDLHYKKNLLRFFTHSINCIGVPKATGIKIGKTYFAQIKNTPKYVIFDYAQDFLKENTLELAAIACDWVYAIRKQYVQEDIVIFEKWLKNYVHDWATCDTFCATVLKAYFAQFTHFIDKTHEWVTHPNPYVRRASAVVLIYFEPSRHLSLRLSRAYELMGDEDLFVQKGYGWMLKKASRYFPEQVYNFVILHKKVMPRLALRYAIEKLPKQLRAHAMAKDYP